MGRRAILLVGGIGLLGCVLLLWGIPQVKGVADFFNGQREGVVIVGASERSCTMPPTTFQESDLIGTWTAGSEMQRDTLILADGGLYRQVVDIQKPSLSLQGGR